MADFLDDLIAEDQALSAGSAEEQASSADFLDDLIAEDQALSAESEGSEDKQFYDDSFLGELGEGVVSGITKLGEGIAGLAAIPVDMALDTDYGDKITQGGEDLRDAMGLDPEGFVGKGAEILSQFVYLPVKAASLAGRGYQTARAARLGKVKAANTPLTKRERFGLASAQIGGAGLAEVAVTTDGTTTIGDWVEMGPTQTEDLIGLRGQEKALGRLRNRLRSTSEATGIGVGVGSALGSLGRTSVGQGVAKAVSSKLDKVGQDIDDLLMKRAETPDEVGAFKTKLADFIAFSRERGFLPDEVASKRLRIEGVVSSEITKAEVILKNLDRQIDKSLKKIKPSSKLDRVSVMSKIEDFLTDANELNQPRSKTTFLTQRQEDILKEIPADIRPNVREMRTHVDKLSLQLRDAPSLSGGVMTPDGKSLQSVIDEGVGSYLRRRYRVFEDANYKPTKESVTAARDFFIKNKTATEKELTRLFQADTTGRALDDEFMLKNGLKKDGEGAETKIKVMSKVTPASAAKAQEAFLSKHAVKGREKLGGGYMAKDRLETGMFVAREEVPPSLRQLMGEVDDPRQAYLSTVADLAQFNAVDDYYDTVATLASQGQGVGRLFKDPSTLTPQQIQGLKDQGYVTLGSTDGSSMVKAANREMTPAEQLVNSQGWGKISGYMVPKSVYKDLTNTVLAEDSFGAFITRATIGTFLKAKGISQYSKTVLSPITQIRNFTTAITFALANGNVPIIGRGGSLSDASKLVFANIRSKGSDAVLADLADAQRRAVLGSNAELREIQDTLNKGVDVTASGPKSFSDAVLGEKLGGALRKVTKPLEDAYQGSDDFWKYFNYNAEQAKLRNALAKVTDEQKIAHLTKGRPLTENQKLLSKDELLDDLIKDRAAQIVIDTVPNYSKAGSDLVRFARKLPVGSFITFPAEMYRTSFNIIRQAIDDMASDIPGIQARGRQRLLGFTTVAGVAPLAAMDLGSAISGVPKEVMEAYKRSFGADWEKGAVLVPTSQDEEGNVSYFNFSTSNPYDTLFRFANRAVTESDKARSEGQDVDKVFTDTMVAGISELFAPFMSESIITEALLDITARGGKTASGAILYRDEESSGAKGMKMFNHVLDTLMPNLIPINVSSGVMEPSRFARGVVGPIFPDLVNPEDKMGRERNLQDEVIRQLSGVSQSQFDPKKNLAYAAGRFNRSQGNAKAIFNRHADDANATGDSLLKAYVAANEAKLRVDRSYYQMFKDLETIGLSPSEIRRELKKEGISGAREVMRGEFKPFELSDKNKKDMREAETYSLFPRSEYNEYRRLMRRASLDEPTPVAEVETVETAAPAAGFLDDLIQQDALLSQPQAVVPEPQPSETFVGRAADAVSDVAGDAITGAGNFLQRARTFAPSILGGDPAAQAANEEILRRQQGQ